MHLFVNDIWSKQFMILYVHNVNGFIYESKNQVRNDKTEILLKVALNIIKQTNKPRRFIYCTVIKTFPFPEI